MCACDDLWAAFFSCLLFRVCFCLSFFEPLLVHLGAALYIRSHVQKGLMICLF